jgi:hypothetical protein
MSGYSRGKTMKDIILTVVYLVLSVFMAWAGVVAVMDKEPSLHTLTVLCAAIGGLLIVAVSLLFAIKDAILQGDASILHSELLEEIKKGHKNVHNIVKSQAELLTEIASK